MLKVCACSSQDCFVRFNPTLIITNITFITGTSRHHDASSVHTVFYERFFKSSTFGFFIYVEMAINKMKIENNRTFGSCFNSILYNFDSDSS